jgi:hypothetical protein
MADESDPAPFGFAPPPFDATAAADGLRRNLRDLKLAERSAGGAFELRGRRVVELSLADGVIEWRVARKLALTPEWDRRRITSAAEQRNALADLRQRLARWERED